MFSKQTQDFFWELSFNNERPWFHAHKEEFEKLINEPFKRLGKETMDIMAERFPADSLELHLSRIYRDARRLFGRGPYKDNLWFSIKDRTDGGEKASFYFEISAKGWGYGMGFWCPKAEQMNAFRKSIEVNPDRFERLAREIDAMPEFTIEGPEYKRPKGDFGDCVNNWYNRKWVSVCSDHDYGPDLYDERLPEKLADEFTKLFPMYEYLNKFSKI